MSYPRMKTRVTDTDWTSDNIIGESTISIEWGRHEWELEVEIDFEEGWVGVSRFDSFKRADGLGPDIADRINANPSRIIDSMRETINEAIVEYMDAAALHA